MHIPGVAGLAGDRLARVAEPVIVVGDRHDPRTVAPANLSAPRAAQRRRSPVDEDLDGVRAFASFGQVPQAKVTLQLHRIQMGTGLDTVTPRSSEPAGRVPPALGFT